MNDVETCMFSVGVLHELADEEEDLLDLMLAHVLARPPAHRTMLAEELAHLAALDANVRTELLEDIGLSWSLVDERGFLSTISSIVAMLSEID